MACSSTPIVAGAAGPMSGEDNSSSRAGWSIWLTRGMSAIPTMLNFERL